MLKMMWELLQSKTLVDQMAYTLIGLSILVFLILSFITEAPYGRYSSKTFGPPVNVKVAWLVQETPSFLLPALLFVFTPAKEINSWTNKVLLIMFCIHYFQRAFVYPLLINGGKGTPCIPFLLAIVFCCYNGLMQGIYLTSIGIYPQGYMNQPNFILGTLLFFAGLAINLHSDHILRNLRKPGESGYKIPQGGLFNFVSGANFLGEITEWWGFALACWSLPALAFAIATTCNIGPRAISHHRWYLEKFKENYPRERRALIPLLL